MKVILTTAELRAYISFSKVFAEEVAERRLSEKLNGITTAEFAKAGGFKENEDGDWVSEVDPVKYVKIIKLMENNISAVAGLYTAALGLYKTFESLTRNLSRQVRDIFEN